MAERYGIQEWDMPRLTGRALALLEREFDGPDADEGEDDVEIPEGADRVMDPPVPSVLRGLI